MNQFSNYNYENISDSLKSTFNKILSQKLSSLVIDSESDDMLRRFDIKEFVESSGSNANNTSFVEDVYSSISGSIQAGSGNQNLYHSVLNAFVESWNEINK